MKKRKRNLKQIRIVIVLLLLIGILCLVLKSIKKNESSNEVENTIPTIWNEDTSPTSNFVEGMSWTDNGINITGTMKNNNGTIYLKICPAGKTECIGFETEVLDNDQYQGEVSLTSLENGLYELFVESTKDEKLTDTRELIDRLVRAKVNDKLVTMDYSNERVKVNIEDFAYEYDILIDPGHGGEDSGSYNKFITEEKINYEQSMYEKERYEDHGLKVKLMREDHSYGIEMGGTSWIPVRRRAYAIGYYSVVSKVSYSNHHNSSINQNHSGWEIIVPARISNDLLKEEKLVASFWQKNYVTRESHVRFYARNGDDGGVFSRANDEIYDFVDYYAVVRIPYDLYNEKNILYEGSYLSNLIDFDWYYTKNNWKSLSEYKIKTYVESLGKTYIPA